MFGLEKNKSDMCNSSKNRIQSTINHPVDPETIFAFFVICKTRFSRYHPIIPLLLFSIEVQKNVKRTISNIEAIHLSTHWLTE